MTSIQGSNLILIIAASAILIAGVVDDLRSKKFHNWLFLTCSALAFVVAVAVGGLSAMPAALLGFIAGFAVMMPLVLMNVLGAGDMKLFAAFGIVAGWSAVLSVGIHALVWGAAFGVLKILLNGQAKTLAFNMLSIVVLRDRRGLELHRIPFAVAILMGWLSHLVLRGVL